MKSFLLTAATAAAAFVLPATADAAVRYTISGGGHVASFKLDTQPTPEFLEPGYSFAVTTGNSMFDGVANLAGITFYLDPFTGPTDVAAGGLTYLDNTSFFAFDLSGPQLFSGTIYAPTLLTFAARELVDLDSGETITISALAVPEPASWALMLGGFGLTGYAMRRKTRVAIA